MGERHDDDTVCCLGSQKSLMEVRIHISPDLLPTVLPYTRGPKTPTGRNGQTCYKTEKYLACEIVVYFVFLLMGL